MKIHTAERRTTAKALFFLKKRHVCILGFMFVFGSIIVISRQSHLKTFPLTSSGVMIDEDGVCVNTLPYSKLHDSRRPQEIESFESIHIERAGGKPFDKEPPKYHVLPPGSSVAYWDCTNQKEMCENPDINGMNIVKGSAWTSDGVEAFDEKDEEFAENNPKRMWVPHQKYKFLGTKRTVLTGDGVAMFGFIPFNFGHCLHDNLPLVAWLRSIVPDSTTFILPDTEMYRNLIDFIDPTFSERIYFYTSNEIVTVEKGTLTVVKPLGLILATYGNTLFRYFRHWIYEHHMESYPDSEKHIIFHTRGGPEAAHGRRLDLQHEQDVLATIHSAMERYGRKEKLVIFSGSNDQGERLSYAEQMNIFRRASTIIGPHGSGLANVIWTNPLPKGCDQRVQMLEFIAGSDAPQVQPPTLYNGYYWVMRGMPVDWHQLLYASNSTSETTFIHLDDLERALDSMWGL
jgi:hypothetical protein